MIMIQKNKNTLSPFCLERLFAGFVVARYLEYTYVYLYKKDLEISINCFHYQ